MTEVATVNPVDSINVDKIVQHLIDSNAQTFDAEGYDQVTVFQILRHPNFPNGITVKYS
jgi:hypothetical protein